MDSRHLKPIMQGRRAKICDTAGISQFIQCTVQWIKSITPGSKQNIRNILQTRGTLKRTPCWTNTRKTAIKEMRIPQRRTHQFFGQSMPQKPTRLTTLIYRTFSKSRSLLIQITRQRRVMSTMTTRGLQRQ